jgi:membrane protein DedA with SNARE-associated domain
MNSFLDFITSTASSSPNIAGALFLMPFLHEDIAITAAALLIAQGRLSVELAFPSVFLGMVTRDLSIYGLGAAARRNAAVRRFLIRPRVQLLSEWLRGNMLWVIFVGRVVPGLMYPTYIAFGWFQLPFTRYALATAGLSVLYLPLIFAFAYGVGRAAVDRVGDWAWLIVLVPIAVVMGLRIRVSIRHLRARRTKERNP